MIIIVRQPVLTMSTLTHCFAPIDYAFAIALISVVSIVTTLIETRNVRGDTDTEITY